MHATWLTASKNTGCARIQAHTRRRGGCGWGVGARVRAAVACRAPPARPCWLPPPPQHTAGGGGCGRRPGPGPDVRFGVARHVPTRGRQARAAPPHPRYRPVRVANDPLRKPLPARGGARRGPPPPTPTVAGACARWGAGSAQPTPSSGRARVGAQRSGVVAGSSACPPTGQVIG